MTRAATRRFEAIKALQDKYLPENNGYMLIDVPLSQIVADVQAMVQLGRSNRWLNCIAEWQAMLIDNPDSTRWALIQGSINAGYAAD